jgi:amidase
MFAPPTAAEVRELAARLGFRLGEEDAERYAALLVEQLDALDGFAKARIPEARPALLFPERAPGHRPAPDEDPHNAWLWKCSIGGGEGLLAGKTVAFKDHIAVSGIPMSSMSYAMEGFVPDFDASVVTRALAAGGEVVGKNTLIGVGYLHDYWQAINPHDAARMTGGSSAGSAAAVAAGEVDISFGGDQHGSVRIPAAYCGVVGLKPSFGLVSHFGATMSVASGAEPSIDHLGPLARTVEDAARALEAAAGYDDGLDPRQARDVPDRLEVVEGLDGGADGLVVGRLAEGFAEPIEDGVAAGVDAALDVLAGAGARIVDVSVPEHLSVLQASFALDADGFRALRGSTALGAGARTLYPSSLVGRVDRIWRYEADALATYTKTLLLLGELSRERFHGTVYAKAHNVRPTFIQAYDRALADVDVLAMPTCLGVAPPAFEEVSYAEGWRRAIDVMRQGFDPMIRNTAPFNYTGHPALALPCGTLGDLPISMQLVGRRFDEAKLLRLGHALESALA